MDAALLLGLLLVLITHPCGASLNYLDATSTCTTKHQLGWATCCEDEFFCPSVAAEDAWGSGCPDLAGTTCSASQIQWVNMSASAPQVTGGECDAAYDWYYRTWDYTYSCCDCPAGYAAYTGAQTNDTCDGIWSTWCVGCTAADEVLSGSYASGWNCTVPAACVPSGTACSFYTCLEDEFACGAKGYPLGYGLKYCDKYAASAGRFTAAGKAWIDGVRLCLQQGLAAQLAEGPQGGLDCAQLETEAFGAHAGCYVDSGVCGLAVDDWVQIAKVVGWKNLVAPFGVLQAAETLAGCAEYYAWLGEELVKEKLEEWTCKTVGLLCGDG